MATAFPAGDMDESASSSCDEFDTRHREKTSLAVPSASVRVGEKRPATSLIAHDAGKTQSAVSTPLSPRLLARSVIHLDVDCFYCQCEELSDPTGTLSSRPLGIGQKHIIVTCNYLARRRGVKKLMLRTEAMRVCPDLIIREGSDLEPYRLQSRKIYVAFRDVVKSLPGGEENRAMKGGMDEMYADLTAAVDDVLGGAQSQINTSHPSQTVIDLSDVSRMDSVGEAMPPYPDSAFIYGDSPSSSVSISEDQSGATVRISNSTAARRATDGIPLSGASLKHLSFGMQPESVSQWGDEDERSGCVQRLWLASSFAAQIRSAIRSDTGFSTCAGVSVSPMLAKIASDLQKPNSMSILYPWRSANILENMPLRRIPEMGSRSLRALTPCLEQSCGRLSENGWWTCRDLLQVPRPTIVAALAKQERKTSCGQISDILMQRCRGIDPALVVDDSGGLCKTVSVEESFRRGTVTERGAVEAALEELFVRLSRLLDERKSCSKLPNCAYPKTLRVSVRLVDKSLNMKCPFVSSSKQCSFDGKSFLRRDDMVERAILLRRTALPLLVSLLPKEERKPFDVTKLNIAATNFDDISRDVMGSENQRSVAHFFTSATKGPQKRPETHAARPYKSIKKMSPKTGLATLAKKKGSVEADEGGSVLGLLSRQGKMSAIKSSDNSKTKGEASLTAEICNVAEIDPQVLSELPDDIASEIRRSYGLKPVEKVTKSKRGIENFFIKKS